MIGLKRIGSATSNMNARDYRLAAERRGGPRPQRGDRYQQRYEQNQRNGSIPAMAQESSAAVPAERTSSDTWHSHGTGVPCSCGGTLTLSFECSVCAKDKLIKRLAPDEAQLKTFMQRSPGLATGDELQIFATAYDEGYAAGVVEGSKLKGDDFHPGVKMGWEAGVKQGLLYGWTAGFKCGEANGWELRAHGNTAFEPPAEQEAPNPGRAAPTQDPNQFARELEVRNLKQLDAMDKTIAELKQLKAAIDARQEMQPCQNGHWRI